MDSETRTTKCLACNAEVSAGAAYCDSCGCPVDAQVAQCTRCGLVNPPQAAFCMRCGGPVTAFQSAAAPWGPQQGQAPPPSDYPHAPADMPGGYPPPPYGHPHFQPKRGMKTWAIVLIIVGVSLFTLAIIAGIAAVFFVRSNPHFRPVPGPEQWEYTFEEPNDFGSQDENHFRQVLSNIDLIAVSNEGRYPENRSEEIECQAPDGTVIRYFSNDSDGDGVSAATKFVMIMYPSSWDSNGKVFIVDESYVVMQASLLGETSMDALRGIEDTDLNWTTDAAAAGRIDLLAQFSFE